MNGPPLPPGAVPIQAQQPQPKLPPLPAGAVPHPEAGALPNPVQEAAGNANDAAMGAWAEGQRRVAETVRRPLEGALNVLGTPQRGATGIAAGVEEGQGLHAIGRAIYDAFNPDEGNQDLDKIVGQVQGVLPKTDNPVGQFAEHFAAQMLTDPLTYLPPLAIAKKALEGTKIAKELLKGAQEVGVTLPGVKKAVKVGTAVHNAYHEHVGNEFRKINTIRPELDEHLGTGAKTARIGIEHRNIAKMNDELGSVDRDLLKKNENALRDVKPTEKGGYALPEEIRQRYLQEAWRYGTPEMRAEAEKMGYRTVEADKRWEKAPEGLLDYDLRKDYQYLGDLKRNMENAPAFTSHGARYGQKEAAFEHTRKGDWAGLDKDQYDRVAARLEMGRNFVRKRRVDRETEAFLKRYGGWKGDGPVDVTKLSHSPKRMWSSSPLRFLSRMGKEAVLASALPHLINNMGTLTYFKGGIPALGRAAAYMVKGLSPEQISRIKSMGAHAEYQSDFSKILGHQVPGVQQMLHASNHILDRGELAMRQALLDHIDQVRGASKNAMDEFQKAQEIRDALGDYRNVSAFVSLMDALGAPFAPFMGVLSKASKQALGSPNAYRFIAPLRAQQDLNQQTEGTGRGDFIVPNPAEAFAQLATGGGFLSPSRTGPIPQHLASLWAMKHGNYQVPNLWEQVGEQAQSYGGPLAGNIGAFFGLPYAAPGQEPGQFDPFTGLLHAILGDYWKNPMSEKPDIRMEKSAERASSL